MAKELDTFESLPLLRQLANLTEILDTKVRVVWTHSSKGYQGGLELEGIKYQLHLEE